MSSGPDLLALVAPNGAGHLRRVTGVLGRLLELAPDVSIAIACEPDVVAALRSWPRAASVFDRVDVLPGVMAPGVTWSRDDAVFADGRLLSWEERLAERPELSSATLILSDNLAGPLRFRPDTVLMGSFLASDVLDAAHPASGPVRAFVDHERALLEAHRPPMLCVGDMATPGVLDRTSAVRVHWMCQEPPAEGPAGERNRVAVLGGRTGAADDLLVEIARLLSDTGLEVLQAAGADVSFGFLPEDYASMALAVCRPGMGTVTDCVAQRVPMVLVHEGNAELAHNAARLAALGVGEDLGASPAPQDVAAAVHRLLAPPRHNAVRRRMAALPGDGLDQAARWLLGTLRSPRESMTEQIAHRAVEWLVVPPGATLREVLRRHDGAFAKGAPAGIALVVDAGGRLLGTVSDGDVRRALLAGRTLDTPAGEAMQRKPIVFEDGLSYGEIVRRLPAELEARGRRSRRFLGKIVLVDGDGMPSRVLDYHQLWEQRVATHRHIGVVGMGYVGLTLALVLAQEGFRVTGVETDREKVEGLVAGRPHVHEVGLPELLREQLDGNFAVTTELPDDCDVFVVAVGTPVVEHGNGREPALGVLEEAATAVGRRLQPGGLVVLRSTVPVGTTREAVLPILERESGLRGGIDFHLSFAPERTAEGLALQELRVLPQIIGGLNDDSVEATAALFRELTTTIVRTESLEAAELAKLVNNAFRDLSFAFANNVAQVAAAFDFDVVAAIEAANRAYPRNPVPLPSPGVGGPCLTKDPYILAASGARAGLQTTLFQQGREVNEAMAPFVADAVVKQLEAIGKDPAGCTLLLCGVAFKGEPETGDCRQSPTFDIAARLSGSVGRLLGHDPVISSAEIGAMGLEPVALDDGLPQADGVLFLNNHRLYRTLDIFDVVRSLRPPPIVYDGWHVFRADEVTRACPSVYMGLGFTRSSVT